jgi:zinc transport system substrate-binding protein
MSRLMLAAAILLAACSSHPGPTRAAAQVQHKLKVVTTLFPLFDMAKHVGADQADVSLLLPPGVEAHSFEPRPSDVVTISEADVFVYTGKFMEPWAEDIIKGAAGKNLTVVDASQGINMIPGVFHDEDEPPGSLDPHIWLDFDNAKTMVTSIARALEARDSANRSRYESRAADYARQLTELDSLYRVTLDACKNHTVIYAGHYAFGYLARRYGLEYLAAQGVSPDAEPTAQDLTRLVDQIRKDDVKYVFYEELVSPKIAQTIAGETHAKMLLLNAAHNLTRDQLDQGLTLFDILRQDLDNLKIGLEYR